MSPRVHVFSGCLLAFALLSSPVHADGPAAAKPSPASMAIALANVAAPQGGVAWGRAEGIIDAQPADVLAVISDYAHYAGLFPHFEKSRVLSQRGGDAIVYLEAKILYGATTLWGQVRMSSRSPAPDTYVVEAKLMKGKGNMEQLLARWEVAPTPDGARSAVVFQLLVDPDLPVPDSLVSSEMKNSAGRAFRALRKRVGQPNAYAARANRAL